MIFWWIGKAAKFNVIVFDSKLLNSITFYVYNNEPTETPDVDSVIELYVRLESKDVPIKVFLLTDMRYCALFVGVIVHVDAVTPTAKGL